MTFRVDRDILDFEDELGAAVGATPKKKKKKKLGAKIGKAFKKIGKVAAVIGTGGLAAAAPGIRKGLKKAVLKTKVGRQVSGALKKGKAFLGSPAKKLVTKKSASSPRSAAKIIKKAVSKQACDCSNTGEIVKMVAAKLTATLGQPLNEANQILAKQEISRQATWEHKKLMTDADFRRKVLWYLSRKAANGNESCQRTVRVLMAK